MMWMGSRRWVLPVCVSVSFLVASPHLPVELAPEEITLSEWEDCTAKWSVWFCPRGSHDITAFDVTRTWKFSFSPLVSLIGVYWCLIPALLCNFIVPDGGKLVLTRILPHSVVRRWLCSGHEKYTLYCFNHHGAQVSGFKGAHCIVQSSLPPDPRSSSMSSQWSSVELCGLERTPDAVGPQCYCPRTCLWLCLEDK